MLQGSMRVPILLLCLAILEARKQRQKQTLPLPKNLDKITYPNDETFERPVDFLHIYREGFGDKDYKQPIDLLEQDMIKPRDREHAIQLLKKANKHNIEWIPRDDTLVFNNPRDEFLYYNKMHNLHKNASTGDKNHLYDFRGMLEKNLAYPAVDLRKTVEVEKTPSEHMEISNLKPRKNISDMFAQNGFYLKPNNNRKFNWTTCDEFSKKALFHSHDIVNTVWLPFYIWSKRGFSTAVDHVFSYPTKKRISYYKASFGPHIQDVDWSQPKLLLKERREILLVSTNRHGYFHGIPDQESPKPEQGNVTLPTILIRIKIHSPYIAMMYCDEFYSVIMAEKGTEPRSTYDKVREASTLGFRGMGVPAHQDYETEKLHAHVAHLRKLEADDRKIIKIKKRIGDVDRAVNH